MFSVSLVEIVVLFQLTTPQRRLQIIPHTIQYSDNITHFALHDM